MRKFGDDIQALQSRDLPMLGTILNLNGKPERSVSIDRPPSILPESLDPWLQKNPEQHILGTPQNNPRTQ